MTMEGMGLRIAIGPYCWIIVGGFSPSSISRMMAQAARKDKANTGLYLYKNFRLTDYVEKSAYRLRSARELFFSTYGYESIFQEGKGSRNYIRSPLELYSKKQWARANFIPF